MGTPARFGNWTTGIGLATRSLICRPAPAETSVPFKMVAGRLVVVPVFVDNQGPFDFLLDTGTNTTVVDTELARRLGLRPIDRVPVTGPGGAQIVPRARLQSLTLGAKVVEDLAALCVDLRAVRRLTGSVRGVVGQVFLSRFNYLLSYQDRRLEFRDGDAAEAPLRGVRLPFDAEEGRRVVAAVAAGQTSYDLPLVPETSRADVRLQDGLLPTNLFRAVYFDNRERFVLLNPRR